jgi:hypothetical protein
VKFAPFSATTRPKVLTMSRASSTGWSFTSPPPR